MIRYLDSSGSWLSDLDINILSSLSDLTDHRKNYHKKIGPKSIRTLLGLNIYLDKSPQLTTNLCNIDNIAKHSKELPSISIIINV